MSQRGDTPIGLAMIPCVGESPPPPPPPPPPAGGATVAGARSSLIINPVTSSAPPPRLPAAMTVCHPSASTPTPAGKA